MKMKIRTLHKMMLTKAKRLGDYDNADWYFTQDDADHSKMTRGYDNEEGYFT